MPMSYLNRQRTKESYFDKLSVKSKGTIKNKKFALGKFNRFITSRYINRYIENIIVIIPTKFTKTKKARITFVSKEAQEYLKPLLTELGDDELVFGVNEDNHASALVELNHFNRLRKRAKFSEDRYDS